jgi:hypothetical protein
MPRLENRVHFNPQSASYPLRAPSP